MQPLFNSKGVNYWQMPKELNKCIVWKLTVTEIIKYVRCNMSTATAERKKGQEGFARHLRRMIEFFNDYQYGTDFQ